MVHVNVRDRSRFDISQSIVVALIFLCASFNTSATYHHAIAENTAHILIKTENEVLSRGSGVFLGTIDDRGYLLTAAHVLYAPDQIGSVNSAYSIKLELPGTDIEARFEQLEFYSNGSSFEQALTKDYIIVSIPVDPFSRHLIYNLNQSIFESPYLSEIIIVGRSRYGQQTTNSGRIVGVGNEQIVDFELKTDDVVERGDSGSLIYNRSIGAINGLLISTDERKSHAVYPERYIDNALDEILYANVDPEYFVGWSITVAPTFQVANKVSKADDGFSASRQETDSYTSFDFELIGARSIKGKDDSPKLGIIVGYSEGEGHALGKFEDVDYTIKAGITWGIASFSEKISGSIGLLLLAHSIDDEFEYEPALSGEMVFSTLKLSPSNTLDIGLRMEFNEFDISSLDEAETSLGISVVFKISWLGKV